MPTLGSRINQYIKDGQYDDFAADVRKKTGAEMSSFDQSMPWGEFVSQVNTWEEGQKMLKPFKKAVRNLVKHQTLGEFREDLLKKGHHEDFRKDVFKKVGMNPSDFDQSMPWEEFKSRVNHYEKAVKMLKPADDLQQTITQDNYSDYMTRMEKIGRALSGSDKKSEYVHPRPKMPGMLGAEFQDPGGAAMAQHASPTSVVQTGIMGAGAIAGLADDGQKTVRELLGGGGYRTAATMAQLMMQPGKKPVDPGVGPYQGWRTAAQEYKEDVVDPRMKMAGVERTLAGVKDEMTGVAMLGRIAMGGGTPEEAWAVGKGLGGGLVRGRGVQGHEEAA